MSDDLEPLSTRVEAAMLEMERIGTTLAWETGQGSFSVVGPHESVFVTRRKGD